MDEAIIAAAALRGIKTEDIVEAGYDRGMIVVKTTNGIRHHLIAEFRDGD